MSSRKTAVIVDMDGTLVNVSGIRHYVRDALLPDGSYTKKNFDAFHKASILCPAHHNVIDMVQHHWQYNRYDVLIVTARSEDYRKVTTDWLYKYAVPYTKVFMRPSGDFRSDVDVKRDILTEIEKTWDVVHAIDDNPNVIALWKEYRIATTVIPGWED